MDSGKVLTYLRQLCLDMDAGRPLRSFHAIGRAVAPLALPAALALGGGAIACETTPAVRLPQDQPEVCDDGIDNDNDGRTDCGDPACGSAANCQTQQVEPVPDEIPMPVPEYAAPIDEVPQDTPAESDGGAAAPAANKAPTPAPTPAPAPEPVAEYAAVFPGESEGSAPVKAPIAQPRYRAPMREDRF